MSLYEGSDAVAVCISDGFYNQVVGEVSNAMAGISSTFAGASGCWYAIRVGSTSAPASESKPEYDAAGHKSK